MKHTTLVSPTPTRPSTRNRHASVSSQKRPKPVQMTDDKVLEVVEVTGLPGICAFRASMHDTCIQVQTPTLARRVSKLQEARLVREAVSGGYLKVYEVPHPLSWAKSYLRKLALERRDESTTPVNEFISMAA